MRVLSVVMAASLLSGCAALSGMDYDGAPEKPFEFKWGWDRGIEKSSAKPGKVDNNGVYEPDAEVKKAVDGILRFPSVSAGFALEVQPESRVTPTINLEAFRVKTPIPCLRWWVVQVGGGAQLADVYFGKLVVPVVDVTVGPWVGWDFDADDVAWGFQATIFKF